MTLEMRDRENREIGKAEGMLEGKTEMVKNLMANLKMSIHEAFTALSVPEEEQEAICLLLSAK